MFTVIWILKNELKSELFGFRGKWFYHFILTLCKKLTLYVDFLIISLNTYYIFGIVNFVKCYLNKFYIQYFGNVLSFMKINLIWNIM